MSRTKKSLLVAAAITGLLTMGAVRSYGQDTNTNAPGKDAKAGSTDKSSCKGKNSCKGKGGCKTDSNSCKGHNDCKGKGGCKGM